MRTNLPLLTRVAEQLRPLLDELVFVRGATTELFYSSRAAARVRLTRDADVICEVRGRVAYHRLGERLRGLGFNEDMSPGAPLCRWRSGADILDVMPTDESILGFGNEWYSYGIRTAGLREIAPGLRIQLLTPPVFIATKLAAYAGRGRGDLRGSHDIEDVVSVIAFRPEIVEELRREDELLRDWVGARIREHLLRHPDAEDALATNLPYARMLPALVPETGARLHALASSYPG